MSEDLVDALDQAIQGLDRLIQEQDSVDDIHREFAELFVRYSRILLELRAPKERRWEVWIEGYRVTGSEGKAHIKGSVTARSFQEACDKLFDGDGYYDRLSLTYWGCRLFPNEAEERLAFG